MPVVFIIRSISRLSYLNVECSTIRPLLTMASNPPSTCCVSGYKRDGIPIGKVKNINGGECK